MPHFTDTSHPPFPTNIPIAALQKISLTKLLDSDESESKALFDSCQKAGFFLLDLRGSENGEQILKDVEVLFGFAEHLFDISIEEKMKYSLRPGSAFG
jgi:isopenicillin N synthase-like dioxygenase